MQPEDIIVIIVLLGYIIFLHIQIAKKNILIESTLKRITGIEKKWKAEELKRFLHDIRKFSFQSPLLNDKLFDENILNFILENSGSSKIYIHYTKDESDATSIIKKGFRFVESFYKTALPVFNDRLDLLIKHNNHKFFGDYIIQICISNDIVNYYLTELDRAGIKSFNIEHILTDELPHKNENSDIEYLLPHKFIKGYINYITGDIVRNPDFDPSYNSLNFMKNIELLENKNENSQNGRPFIKNSGL
jgi:hypothetical protein